MTIARKETAVIIGTVNNSTTAQIEFPFFSGPAGICELNDRRLQVAYFAPRAMAARGEGLIGDQRYVVDGPASSSTVKGMIVMSVRPIDLELEIATETVLPSV